MRIGLNKNKPKETNRSSSKATSASAAPDLLKSPTSLMAASRTCACGGGCPRCAHDATISSVLNSPGEPLDTATRTYMEPRLGQNLGAVRIHRDTTAADSALKQGARAYALGRDLVFGKNEYAPHTPAGRRLLSHELTHAVQQNLAPNNNNNSPVLNTDQSIEAEAARSADSLAAGGSFRPALRSSPKLARQIYTQYPFESEVVGEARRRPRHYNETHYDLNSRGHSTLHVFRGTESYTLTRTQDSVYVVVRIRLLPAHTVHPNVDTYPPLEAWLTGIRSVWNNRFALANGSIRLPLVFDPIFTNSSPHHRVRIHPENQPIRTDQNNWNENDEPITIAHEFGHMLGNPDEYRLPGRNIDISRQSGLSRTERRRSSWEGIFGTRRPARRGGYGVPDSIMNDDTSHGTANLVPHERHIRNILNFFNARLRQPNEAPFHTGT